MYDQYLLYDQYLFGDYELDVTQVLDEPPFARAVVFLGSDEVAFIITPNGVFKDHIGVVNLDDSPRLFVPTLDDFFDLEKATKIRAKIFEIREEFNAAFNN